MVCVAALGLKTFNDVIAAYQTARACLLKQFLIFGLQIIKSERI